MIDEMEQCDNCHGRGFNTGYACPGFHPFTVACEPCNQSGFVRAGSQDADRLRKANAEGRRLNRISRGTSLRDEARYLGLTPLQLSDMEHGRSPWPWEPGGPTATPGESSEFVNPPWLK